MGGGARRSFGELTAHGRTRRQSGSGFDRAVLGVSLRAIVSGGSDDRVVTLYGMPTSQAASFPTDEVVMNVERFARFKTVEASASKRDSRRWSGQIGFAYTRTRDFPVGFPQNPNQPGVYDRTGWGLKMTGTFDMGWGVRLSPVVRHQSGLNFAREISVPGSAATPFGLTLPATTYYTEDASVRREDNIWVFDVRAEKTLNVSRSHPGAVHGADRVPPALVRTTLPERRGRRSPAGTEVTCPGEADTNVW